MKNHDIVKLCADSLRVFLIDKHGIKLKSGHAHEIVAAFLGYKSAISLRQDTQYSITHLDQAEYILFDTSSIYVEERLKSLEGLPPDLPPSYILAEGIYPVLVAQDGVVEKLWPGFHDLAVAIGEDHLHQRMKPLGVDLKAINWIMDVKKEFKEDTVWMSVTLDYAATDGKRLSQGKVDITLPRLAGNIGYGRAEILPTFYSGQMRDPEFRLKLGIS